MTKVWKWIAIICLILLILGAALVLVAYATGGGFTRLLETTDFLDMTKYFSRETLETYVSMVLG